MKKLLFIACICLTAVSANAKTTISFWQFWTDPTIKPVIEEMVAAFEKENPDIEVELTDLTWSYGHQKIAVAFASGQGPDVVELGSDWIAEFAVNGHLYDMSGEVKDSRPEYQGWSMATYADKVFAHPWFLGTRVLFANGDLLKQAGYEETYAPATFLEMMNAGIEIDKLGKDIYGFGSNTAEKHRLYKKFLPVFWSFDGQLFSDDGRLCLLASDNAVQSLGFYKSLHDTCGYVNNQRGIEDAFLDGKVGFIFSGDWLLKRIENEKRNINLVSSFMPGLMFSGKSFLGGEFLAINNASDKKEAAMKLVRFITNPDNQVAFCKANRSANPSSIEAQSDEYFTSNPHLQTFIKQIRFAKHPPVDPDWVKIEELIEEAVKRTLFDGVSPGTALLEARKKIESLKQ